MSLKYRLRIFFFLLTVLPLLAAGYAVQEVFRENRASRVDSSLASALGASVAFYRDRREVAIDVAQALARDPDLQKAAVDAKFPEVGAILGQRPISWLSTAFEDPNGTIATGAAPVRPAFIERVPLVGSDGKALGTVLVGFNLGADVAGDLSDGDVAVGFRDAATLTTQDGAKPVVLPITRGLKPFAATVGDQRVRMLERDLADTLPPVAVAAVYPQALIDTATTDVRTKVALVIGFVLLAILILAELLVRSITGVLGTFSRRAIEIGEGRFKGDLPVQGNDEFATFARSFNTMAAELEQRIEELDGERRRVQEAVARFGQALESTHDVSALLGIVIESAMEAVGARGGRVVIVDEQSNTLVEHRRLGTAVDLSEDVLPSKIVIGEGVEGLAAQTGHPALQNDPVPVLAVPLQTTQAVVGLLTVTDPSRGTFDEEDGGTLQALASQGAIAIANARMHRLITKQASTDGLTGLNNHRDFHEQLRREIERTERFTLPLALIILDLDDFKLINDRFGHLTGDAVLRDVASTLKEGIREIDTAARYGGEEFAIILPGTTAEGAARLAERLRVAIAERPATNPDDHRVSVTASFGIAAMPADGTTQVELVAASDEALYRAKRAGKNRIAIAAAHEPQA